MAQLSATRIAADKGLTTPALYQRGSARGWELRREGVAGCRPRRGSMAAMDRDVRPLGDDYRHDDERSSQQSRGGRMMEHQDHDLLCPAHTAAESLSEHCPGSARAGVSARTTNGSRQRARHSCTSLCRGSCSVAWLAHDPFQTVSTVARRTAMDSRAISSMIDRARTPPHHQGHQMIAVRSLHSTRGRAAEFVRSTVLY